MKIKGEVMPTVLSIEPHELSQKLFRDLISYKGDYDLTCVTSPLKAMSLLEQGKKFDLIISEVRLPDMSGLTFAQCLSKSEWSRIPLVAWTACAFKSEREAMLEAGFKDVLVKSTVPNQGIIDFVRKHAYSELRFAA